MKVAEIIEQLNEATEGEGILYPNYEEALIGICRRFGCPPVALYDYDKCIDILIRDFSDNGEEDEPEEGFYQMAVEWIEVNSLGAWMGEYTPAFAVIPKDP